MTITCEAASDLLAAYALKRLDREDRQSMQEHLAGCRKHDAELADYEAISRALPMTVEDLRPPPRLRAGLLAEFDRAAPAAYPARASSLRRVWASPGFAYALAAALAVIAIGLAVWNVSLRSDEEPVLVLAFEQGSTAMRIFYLRDERIAILDVDMPALSASQTYQAWLIPAEGVPVSMGVLGNRGTFAFHADLQGAKAIAISVEPAGGSPQPTTTPIIIEEL